MRRLGFAVIFVVLGLAISAKMVSPKQISIETAYPEPGIEWMKVNGRGDVLELKFFDQEDSVTNPQHNLGEWPIENVDLIEFYNLPWTLLVLRDRSDGAYFYGKRKPSTRYRCGKVGAEDLLEGVFQSYFSREGEMVRLVLPDGQEITEDCFDLTVEDIVNVDILWYRTYVLVEYLDRETGEVIRRILRQ